MSDKEQKEQRVVEKKGVFSRVGDSLAEKGKSVVGYDSIRRGWDDIAESAKILNPFKKKKRAIREETFDQAYSRNRLSETALARIYRNQMIAFYVSLSTACVCAVLALAFLNTKGVFSCLSAIGPMLVCLSLSVSSSFKMLKIRRRNLGLSFEDWKGSPSEWLPKKFKAMHREKREKKI